MDEARYRVAERALWKSLNVTPTEHMIELPSTGSSVRIQEIGQGDPVLFVYGGAVNGSSWAPLAAELSDFRCLLVDLPGCGLSPAPPKTYSEFEDFYLWADDLVADVLDGVGVDSAPVICTSFGGYYAFRGAAAHPQRFDQLVGAGAIFGSRMDHMPMVMRVGSIRPFAKLMARMPANRRVVRAMLRQIGLKDALKAGRVTGVFEEWFLANMRHTDTLKNAVEVVPLVINMRGMVPEAVISGDILGSISCPTKLIWGEADPMAGPDVARGFAVQLPDCDLELWPESGHAPWIDHPDHAATSIRNFLRPS